MIRALFDGIGRVLSAPALVGGVYLVTLLLAAPLTLALHDAIAAHLGASAAADQAVAGVHWEWWEEFQAQARGFERTFTPSIIGFGAVLSNLSAFVDGAAPAGGLAVAVAFYLAAWTFLAGGILDRLARRRRLGGAAFFAACGTYFFRFLRLAVVAGLAYWLLFDLFHEWLLEDLYEYATRNVTVERTAFLVRVAGYALFGALVLPVNLLLDYAKIRAVVEDRRSMLGALLAAGRFVRRRPLSTGGLYVLNAGPVRAPAGRLRCRRPRRGRAGQHLGVDGAAHRPGVRAGARGDQARVLRVADRVLPEPARPRRLRRRAAARPARVARRGDPRRHRARRRHGPRLLSRRASRPALGPAADRCGTREVGPRAVRAAVARWRSP